MEGCRGQCTGFYQGICIFCLFFPRLEIWRSSVGGNLRTGYLQQKFTLFSMKDTHPVEPTTEWYYQTAKTFPRDGKPVYIQVGSRRTERTSYIPSSPATNCWRRAPGSWATVSYSAFHLQGGICVGHRTELYLVKQGKCYTRIDEHRPSFAKKKLNIAWKTFRNRLTPADKEEWTLKITTPDGKPAKAH